MARGQYEPASDSTTNTVEMAMGCDNHEGDWWCLWQGDVEVAVNGTVGVWSCPACDYEHTMEVTP